MPDTQLPSPIAYGTVRGRFVTAALDGNDADSNPDSIPTSGKVTFTPNVPAILVHSANPPLTVVSSPITVQLDSTGAFTVRLMASKGVPGVTPTAWAYNVSFQFAGQSLTGFPIDLEPDMVRDLTLAAPTPSAPGIVTVVSEQTRIDAEAAAARAEAAALRAEGAVGLDPAVIGAAVSDYIDSHGVGVSQEYVDEAIATIELTPGPEGPEGPRGKDGATGKDGAPGKSVELRNNGTSIQWRLVGDTAWQDIVPLSAITGPPGEAGDSTEPGGSTNPAQITAAIIEYVTNNQDQFASTYYVDEAIATIELTPGPAGDSAYQLALSDGFDGTLSDWLASLKGADGEPGRDGADGEPGRDGVDGERGPQGPEGPPGATTISGINGLQAALDSKVTANGAVTAMVPITQAAYDALAVKSPTTLYIISVNG